MRFNFFSELPLLYITKLFNLDHITNENNKEHNENGHIFLQITRTEF